MSPRNTSGLVSFKKGFDAKRHIGAPNLGRQITAHMNELGREDDEGHAVYDAKKLREIVRDGRSAHARVVACKEILRARMDGFDTLGRTPKAADSIDRLIDRTHGKPKQTIFVQHENTAEQLTIASARLQELLTDPRLPELAKLARREFAEQQAKQLPAVVETTAKVVSPTGEATWKDIEPVALSPADGKPKPKKRRRKIVLPLGG